MTIASNRYVTAEVAAQLGDALDQWWNKAACAGQWTVMEAADDRPAMEVCRFCPVISECANWVLDLPQRLDPEGICGGMNEKRRRRYRMKRGRR